MKKKTITLFYLCKGKVIFDYLQRNARNSLGVVATGWDGCDKGRGYL